MVLGLTHLLNQTPPSSGPNPNPVVQKVSVPKTPVKPTGEAKVEEIKKEQKAPDLPGWLKSWISIGMIVNLWKGGSADAANEMTKNVLGYELFAPKGQFHHSHIGGCSSYTHVGLMPK